ncbi:MAG: elongation factor P hydroxylase [Hahellaceae bacterium]|nr:elongation factor P hydroxylase [Hahellaceae bacterium]
MNLDINDLITIFNTLFGDDLNTRLVKGDGEPVYLPADSQCDYHRVIFAHGYFASALHEISHWCIAGAERRKLVDFGYWYQPDGRTADQQRLFESVEVKPQALEWIFAEACGSKFHISVDNLNGESSGTEEIFKKKVQAQVLQYLSDGLPERPRKITEALLQFYDRASIFGTSLFENSKL